MKGGENTPQQAKESFLKTFCALPSLQETTKGNMPHLQKSRKIVTMLGSTIVIVVLIGLTVAGVTSEQNSNKNDRKSSDLDEEIMADFEDESISVLFIKAQASYAIRREATAPPTVI